MPVFSLRQKEISWENYVYIVAHRVFILMVRVTSCDGIGPMPEYSYCFR